MIADSLLALTSQASQTSVFKSTYILVPSQYKKILRCNIVCLSAVPVVPCTGSVKVISVFLQCDFEDLSIAAKQTFE